MTSVLSHPNPPRERIATRRRYLMCPPDALRRRPTRSTPGCDPGVPVDRDRALAPVGRPARAPTSTSATASTCSTPVPGLPDMVYAANGATVLDGMVSAPGSGTPSAGRGDRAPRLVPARPATPGWSSRAFVNEGEGDLLVAGPPGDRCCWPAPGSAPTRGRTPRPRAVLGAAVVPLELVDPRFYHLDTALAVLDATTIAWLPEAFSPASRAVLRRPLPGRRGRRRPPTPPCSGLNAVSDGRHVVLPAEATDLAAALAERGFVPVPVELSELLQGRRRSQVLHVGGARMTAIAQRDRDRRSAPRALVDEHSAHNYHPLPVVVAHAEGAWVTDVEGRRYLDCLAGYSALNFGHGHPALLAAAHRQLDRVTLTSRAFGNDQLGPFCAELAGAARASSWCCR